MSYHYTSLCLLSPRDPLKSDANIKVYSLQFESLRSVLTPDLSTFNYINFYVFDCLLT